MLLPNMYSRGPMFIRNTDAVMRDSSYCGNIHILPLLVSVKNLYLGHKPVYSFRHSLVLSRLVYNLLLHQYLALIAGITPKPTHYCPSFI